MLVGAKLATIIILVHVIDSRYIKWQTAYDRIEQNSVGAYFDKVYISQLLSPFKGTVLHHGYIPNYSTTLRLFTII